MSGKQKGFIARNPKTAVLTVFIISALFLFFSVPLILIEACLAVGNIYFFCIGLADKKYLLRVLIKESSLLSVASLLSLLNILITSGASIKTDSSYRWFNSG